jgi:hypothetical protein
MQGCIDKVSNFLIVQQFICAHLIFNLSSNHYIQFVVISCYRYTGPYVVHAVLGKGAYVLAQMNGKQLKCRCPAKHLRRYVARAEQFSQLSSTESVTSMAAPDHVSSALSTTSSNFNAPTEQWQQNVCGMLQIKFIREVKYLLSNTAGSCLQGWLPQKQKRIVGDGNCFYRSLSFIVCGDEQNHEIMRALVVSHMNGPFDKKLKEIYSKELLANHQLREWSTDAEVFGAASLLDVNIHVFVSYLKLWQTFTVTKSDKTSLYILLECGHFEPIVSLS